MPPLIPHTVPEWMWLGIGLASALLVVVVIWGWAIENARYLRSLRQHDETLARRGRYRHPGTAATQKYSDEWKAEVALAQALTTKYSTQAATAKLNDAWLGVSQCPYCRLIETGCICAWEEVES